MEVFEQLLLDFSENIRSILKSLDSALNERYNKDDELRLQILWDFLLEVDNAREKSRFELLSKSVVLNEENEIKQYETELIDKMHKTWEKAFPVFPESPPALATPPIPTPVATTTAAPSHSPRSSGRRSISESNAAALMHLDVSPRYSPSVRKMMAQQRGEEPSKRGHGGRRIKKRGRGGGQRIKSKKKSKRRTKSRRRKKSKKT
tara:strand:- start:297 stop:911 length:615 start_codon:yes stop_codon:yes gene_type:complete